MKRLILMRHAKSSWEDLGQTDHDRPLNARGRRSADALGDWLRDQAYVPDEVLSSTSARTRETYERLRLAAEAKFIDALYHASADRLMAVLRRASGDTVLVLAHNPGIAWFAQEIASRPPEHPRFDDYPTGATLVAAFDIPDWDDLTRGTGQVLDFVIPRELTG